MTDYYSILGLTKNASDIEIKTAFRKLAKIYHPDKNPNDPNAKLLFENILKAYNTLTNPYQRKRYDASQISPQTQSNKSQRAYQKNQKVWAASEEEIKQREYYKNYYQSKKNSVHQTPKKPSYSDYKYILFATPIAVGLFMLIISIFSTEPRTEIGSKNSNNVLVQKKQTNVIQLANGDTPYSSHFGNIKTVNTNHILKINNSTNYDAVICVFDKKTKTYLQHSYVKSNFSITFSMLPKTGVYWKCVIGNNWIADKPIYDHQIIGGFDRLIQYQNWESSPILFHSDDEEEITFLSIIDTASLNNQFICNDVTFFEK